MKTRFRTIGVLFGAICILILLSFTRTESAVSNTDGAATASIEVQKVIMEANDALGKIELLANVEAVEYHNAKNSALTNQATEGQISDREQIVLDDFRNSWEGIYEVTFNDTTGIFLLYVQSDNFINILSNLPNGDNESMQIWGEYVFTMLKASQKMLSDLL